MFGDPLAGGPLGTLAESAAFSMICAAAFLTPAPATQFPGAGTALTGTQRLVRRAWRSAQRLGADLDLLWISPPAKSLTDEQQRSLAALRELASVLGARLLVEESDNVPEAIADVARRQRTTYILMGRSRPARGLARLRTPLPQRLLELLPGVDVRIVADRARRPPTDQP